MSANLQILKTTCPLDCPDTCSILATVQGGRVTRLQGDPQHPFTRGFLCHKVANYHTLVSARLTDLGEGSTFQCNLVEVEKAASGAPQAE